MLTSHDVELELKKLGLAHLVSDEMVDELVAWAAEPD